MPDSTCAFVACEKPSKCRGWCSAHYERWRKHGDPAITLAPVAPPRRPKRERTQECVVAGCETFPRYSDYCQMHYQRVRKHGDPLKGERRKRLLCTVGDCGAKVHGHGMCFKHYNRHRNSGSTDLTAKRTEVCTADACNEPTNKRGWFCEAHYMELRRHGRIGSDRTCADCASPIAWSRLRCASCAHAKRLLAAKNQGHVRRALLRGSHADSFNVGDVYERDGWTCGICYTLVDAENKWPHPMSASLDHVVPLIKGGAHTLDNVQLAHLRCNTSKGDREHTFELSSR